MDALRQARAHVGRGGYDEALVLLWNAVEPARLAGDRRSLRTIESLSRAVVQRGDEAQKREAERLLETLGKTAPPERAVSATARLDADVSPEGYEMASDVEDEMASDDYAEDGSSRGARIGNIVWLLVVIAVVVFNLLEQAR